MIKKLKDVHIHSLHTLSVWTPYGDLLVAWHKFLNGERQPYVNGTIKDPTEIRHHGFLMSSLESRGEKTFKWTLNDGRSNSFDYDAAVVCAAPIPGVDKAWALMLHGNLVRLAYAGHSTEAKMACFYQEKSCDGFILIPELARQQLRSHD